MPDIASIELTEVGTLPEGKELEAKLSDTILNETVVGLTVNIGEVEMSIADLKSLKENAILSLGQDADADFELKWKHVVVAKGRLVAIDEQLGIEVTEVCASGF